MKLESRYSLFPRVHVILLAILTACFWPCGATSYAQAIPTGDQLDQLVAPIALYPDQLLAQICAASTDPQQIIDADNWLKQNKNLQGQALTDAAQKHGFDPAFVSLVNFPQVLDMMAAHIDDYAALGSAFAADQKPVMAAIQRLRQQAYASGALDSNEYQKVSVQQQGSTQVVIVQPANPQIVYVPQYQPQAVYAAPGPSTGDVVAASLLSFSAGIALGVLISNNNQPWGWGGWGWGWGGGGVIVHHNVYVVHNHYRSPYPPYRPRPPMYGPPIYARPPGNWYQRPGYHPPPPGYRPGGPNYRPPANGGGTRPPTTGGGTRPPTTGGGTRPPGNVGGTRPPTTGGGTKPPGNGGGTRPPTNAVTRPAPGNSYAGYPQGGTKQQAQRPQPQTTGSRPGGLSGNSSGNSERAASSRGKTSAGGGSRPGGRSK